MYLVFMGPPGAGKGTQAALVARTHRIAHISTGEMLRSAVKARTEMGTAAKEYMDRGDLVPDEIVVGITRERLQAPDVRKGFVLDGFPRTLKQAEDLDRALSDEDMDLDLVVNLQVPEGELVRRLTGRRVCPHCGESYHLVFNPPSSLGVCDYCGKDLVQRDDDLEVTVRQRLEVYRTESEPLLGYYSDSGLLVNVHGTGTVQQVHERIEQLLV